jgi:beta-lactamase superfamily II metal-dependent hydrolase
MVKITFKDVGQGDSIIIEWENEKKEIRIGIIDCKRKERKNPILDYIKSEKIKEIDFLILSHPHTDHYSGMKDLLEYCFNNKILLKKFCHTLKDIEIEYWKYLEPNITNSKELKDLFEIVLDSYGKNLQEIIKLDFDYRIYLNDNYYLRCLSPSHLEKAEYVRSIDALSEKSRMKRSKAANLLSTVFKLKLDNQFILFTSDAEKITFQRIRDKNLDFFNGKYNLLCQIPHHGSDTNHEPSFWSCLKINQLSEAIISAGEHRSYNHPHFSVITDFSAFGYKIKSTNVINGMEEHVDYITSKSLILDTNSFIAEEFYISGDKVFTF